LKEENTISNLSCNRFSQQEKKCSTEKKLHEIIQEKEIGSNDIKQNKEHNILQNEKQPVNTKLVDSVTKFVLGELTSREFFRILRLNNIRPEVLEIKKWIKSINKDAHNNNKSDRKIVMINDK